MCDTDAGAINDRRRLGIPDGQASEVPSRLHLLTVRTDLSKIGTGLKFVSEIRDRIVKQQKHVWKNRLLKFGAAVLLLAVVLAFWLKSYATPTIRDDIKAPLYTIGDANYASALADGKSIVKFGRSPFGIYPGGVAFDNTEDANAHLAAIGKKELGWKVYVLSGDFGQDTVLIGDQHYTNKSLLVQKEATADGTD